MDTMAYVIWRVFMKKYSKIRLGIHRNIAVNPAQPPVDIGDGKWGYKSATLPAGKSHATSKGTCQEPASKSSKCPLRVDNSSTNVPAKDTEDSTSKCADIRPKSAFVTPESQSATASSDIPDKSATVSSDIPAKSATASSDIPAKSPTASSGIPAKSATASSDIPAKSANASSDIPAKSATASSDIPDKDPQKCATVSGDTLHKDCQTSIVSVTQKSSQDTTNISICYVEHEDPSSAPETASLCPENKGDVANLVETHFGPLYPSTSLPILIRQARDLLVCTYHGNLQRLEQEFCRPAAELIRTVRKNTLEKQSTDVVAPRGWPLSLAGRVVLHLGQLDPTLLRNRDCYLCVNQDVRVVLVWKWNCTIHSRELKPSSLLTPLVLEMAVSEADDLPGLLQALLVSVERAIERVPLDELSFPCPRCALDDIQDGRCSCPSSTVQKKDTSIQTSPMFEVVGSIPHIDSDEDSGEDCENHKVRVAVHSVTPQGVEEQLVVVPTSIADIPDHVLTSGICLPGTHDLKGRPLVLYDVTAVQRTSLSYHQIASLLVYYCSLPSRDRLQDGITILAQLGQCDPAALDVLDKSLYLTSKHVKIASVLLSSPSRWQRSVITLSRSRLQCRVVSEQSVLHQHIAEDQLPSHDQAEWLHFYKELEPFLALCQSCGRRLVGVMTELRASEGCPTLTRRQLHHQHKALSRALGDADLQRLRRDGPGVVSGLEERAQWLPASEDVRLSTEQARSLFEEVDRAARRLETLWEGRRERIRDLARVRALEDETEQVLSWLCKKGEETLRRHTQLASNLSAIKEQEQDFERFYFISMVSSSTVYLHVSSRSTCVSGLITCSFVCSNYTCYRQF